MSPGRRRGRHADANRSVTKVRTRFAAALFGIFPLAGSSGWINGDGRDQVAAVSNADGIRGIERSLDHDHFQPLVALACGRLLLARPGDRTERGVLARTYRR